MIPTDFIFPMKTVETSLLKIAYEELNPTGKRCVILLHGWPDSPRTWNCVAPELANQGWRVLVPALRGFSPTEFLKKDKQNDSEFLKSDEKGDEVCKKDESTHMDMKYKIKQH
jgi:pimeloyl-ACP methyl ester carboxylesterase